MNSHKIRTSLNKIGVIFTTFLFLFTFSTLIFNSIFNNIIISKYFFKIEKQDVISKMEQSKKIFEYQFKGLDSIVQDYAIWDDIYNKMQDKNIDKKWFDINYSKWLPDKLNIDLIIVANRNKEIVLQYGLSDNSNTILNDNKISQSFNENSYNENISFTGFKEYNGDIYLIGACPIFQTTTEGTSKGVVILGKKITPTFLRKINEQFGNDILITYDNKFVSTPELKDEFEKNSSILNNNKNNQIYEFNNSKIIGSSNIMDISGNNVGNINVIQPRELFISTQKLMQRNSLLITIMSCVLLFILGFKFKGIIVNPIKKLETQIKNMEHENLLVHTHVNGPNEIISLAESFNHMVDSVYAHIKENEELKTSSNIDPLTSAYNHKYYFECIRNIILEGHKKIAVLFCDIDKFKLTNDTYGHGVGDLLLIEIAKLMTYKVKDTGIVFRYGGEEFVIILCDYTNEDALIEAEKIRKSIAKSPILQQYSDYFPITLSIGIATYPHYGLDAETLIKNADTAMYYSKQNGRNQCTVYTDDLNDFFKDCNKLTTKELLMDSVLSLAEAVDAKDYYTGKHSKMVSKYSILLAEELDFTEAEKNKLRIGSLLHDCGKIGIPDNIINKPENLSDYEFTIIKNHTILGTNIIKHITNDEKIIHCVRCHHERYDGKGYPDGLSGTSIDLFARIVCIADVYHAMTSDRPYRKTLSQEKVIEEFIKGKGTQFDPYLVDIFVEMIKSSMLN